jgi:hypothetical protein
MANTQTQIMKQLKNNDNKVMIDQIKLNFDYLLILKTSKMSIDKGYIF